MSRETVYPPFTFCGSATKTRWSLLTQGGGVSGRVGAEFAFFEDLLFNPAIKRRFGFLGLSGRISPTTFSDSTNGLLELHPMCLEVVKDVTEGSGSSAPIGNSKSRPISAG